VRKDGFDLAEFLDIEQALRLEAAARIARRRARHARRIAQLVSA
jgi:hypothetical protein